MQSGSALGAACLGVLIQFMVLLQLGLAQGSDGVFTLVHAGIAVGVQGVVIIQHKARHTEGCTCCGISTMV